MIEQLRRRLYSGSRPHPLARRLNSLQGSLAAAGLPPRRLCELQVRGRRTGRMLSLPVVVADLDGERYLVAMLGEKASWPANVRAAGGRAILRHGRAVTVRLEEVPADQRAPILRRYLQLAPGARPHVPVAPDAPASEFAAVAGRYPVFRIASP